jgi:hypothetical protein
MLRQGFAGIGIEMNGYGWVGKLHGADVDQVTPHHELLAFALHKIDGVPRGVSTGGDRLDPSD